jgi:peptidoglycan/xylan/chitin deacetylase (PgdA/CDA1 family)
MNRNNRGCAPPPNARWGVVRLGARSLKALARNDNTGPRCSRRFSVDTRPVSSYYSYDHDERTESHIVIQRRSLFEKLHAVHARFEEIARGDVSPEATRVRLYALLYHDILDGADADSSGLTGAGASIYKLDVATFKRHLDAIAQRLETPPGSGPGLRSAPARGSSWLLTFDDGGSSAFRPTADLLDQRRWTGHFFVTSGRVGSPGFLAPAQIRELRARGHVIGSHSWSHPARFSALSPARMNDEWARSIDQLAEILEEPVLTASVPGGYYSPKVAEAAARAGITTLFTSEPVSRPKQIQGCLVVGRFSVMRDTPPARAAALAAGDTGSRAAQWLAWNGKKALKRVAGDLYDSARDAVLTRRSDW